MTPQAVRTVRTLDAPAPAERTVAPVSLLDQVLAQSTATSTAETSRSLLAEFLSEPSPWKSLVLWLGSSLPRVSGKELKRELALKLSRDIAAIDELLNEQTNAILHHRAFQKLESSWRGLRWLVEQVPEGENIKIRVLSATWKELVRDQERAMEFDQSNLFRKVYNEEFGTPGGEPYGLLIGDYDIHPRPSADHPMDDLSALQGISSTAAAAFAPFIAAAHPSLLELDGFPQLENLAEIGRHFAQIDYIKWKSFRETEDSRFVGLALPNVLMRAPYEDDGLREDGFRFREDVSASDRSGYLFGNAAYAFGAVAIRAFADTSWLADIRGVRRAEFSGGVVAGLPTSGFTVGRGTTPRSLTDAHITDVQEKELTDLGFLSLCHCPDSEQAAFYGAPSVQKPRQYDEAAATANARLTSMLHYTLCASRFAHYIKVMVRDRIGAFTSPAEIEDRLRKWLQKFIISNDEASPEMKSRYPLREAKVQVREIPGKPGNYHCVIHLRPHFQLDQLSAGIRLTTELVARDNV